MAEKHVSRSGTRERSCHADTRRPGTVKRFNNDDRRSRHTFGSFVLSTEPCHEL